MPTSFVPQFHCIKDYKMTICLRTQLTTSRLLLAQWHFHITFCATEMIVFKENIYAHSFLETAET